jgi:peroxiredoxin Q/BCP
MPTASRHEHGPLATVGRPAPEFAAIASGGRAVRLRDLRGRKVVLFFYPKDSTPGCTRQACGFRDLQAEFGKVNAVVFGVNPGSSVSHDRFRQRQQLPFELLVDEEHAIASLYGVWQEKVNFGVRHFGVVRSHFVIDEDGVLVAARVPVSADEGPREALASVRDAERARRARLPEPEGEGADQAAESSTADPSDAAEP